MKVVQNRKIVFAISIILIVMGLGIGAYNKFSGKGAFNYDIQFTGGTSIEANVGKEFQNSDVSAIMQEAAGVGNAQIQKKGQDGHNFVIKTRGLTQEEREAVVKAISEKYGITKDVISVTDISATISGEMKEKAVLSVLVSCLAMLIYVTFRFKDIKMGTSAIAALANDALILVGFYAAFRIPLNNSFIAAILTVLGYSINSTIIIFDRVRENKRKNSSLDKQALVNTSVTQTLRRTVFTSLTTLTTIGSLYVFGVDSVKEFALPIMVGVLCGAFSSVFLAGSLWYTLSEYKSKKA